MHPTTLSTMPDLIDDARGAPAASPGLEGRTGVHSGAATDEELVRRYQAGTDREGVLVELFERYGAVTYAFLRRRIGDVQVAEEINQDLYIGVIESLDRFRGESSFKTWLFRMALNRIQNLRRRWRTHLDELPDTTPDELIEQVVASGDDLPDERYAKDERNLALERCLAALPDVQRAVVVGQYYENVTLEELTRRFQMTNRSGARASLIAAQRKLRRCLERAGATKP